MIRARGISPAEAIGVFDTIATAHDFTLHDATLDPALPKALQRFAQRGGTESIQLVIRGEIAQFIFETFGVADDLKPMELVADDLAAKLNSRSVSYERRVGRSPIFWGP
jgi:hypothetical protein